MGEEVVDLWEAEDAPDDDYVVEQATRSSISAGAFHTSTKLDGSVWLENTEKMVHVPKDQADDVNLDDDDDAQEEVEFLPTLQVIVRPQEGSKKEEDVSSRERGNIRTSRTLWRDRDT